MSEIRANKRGNALRPVIAPCIFQKWGLDFIRPINPIARFTKKKYILAIIEYTTKWVEAIATREANSRVTAKFLYHYVCSRYGLPHELVSDQGSHFLNSVVEALTTMW